MTCLDPCPMGQVNLKATGPGRNLPVTDDHTGLFSSPGDDKNYGDRYNYLLTIWGLGKINSSS